jgi:hypothetical protein
VTTDPIERIRDPDGKRITFGQPMTQPEEEAEP